MKKIKILHVVGARPNFIKIAPLMHELRKYKHVTQVLVHTGQHYDKAMSEIFFKELNIPEPDINLGVGGATAEAQLGMIMEQFETVCKKEKPDTIVVVGDVTSTLAAALVANKLSITLAHVESGLRSFDLRMPEEVNRIATDELADILFAPDESSVKNLKKEKVRGKIILVGNIMIDALQRVLRTPTSVIQQFGLAPKSYCVATLHRQGNVDNKTKLEELLDILDAIPQTVVWPIHPRTQKNITAFGLNERLKKYRVIAPLGYRDFISLVYNAALVITDSGGVQEETTYMRIPCLTLRKTTEWTATVTHGTNQLVQNKQEVLNALNNPKASNVRLPKYWDGKTATRIAKALIK